MTDLKTPLLPIYVTHTTKKLFKIDFFTLKTLILILICISSFGLFLLFFNLPNNINDLVAINKEDIELIFIPKLNNSINDHHNHLHQPIIGQQQEPPIDLLNKQENNNKDDNINDKEIIKKREKIREMMLHSWNNYVKYAWGHNELKPLSKQGHSAGIFGSNTQIGATIVDALDTLYLMGFIEEFNMAKEWINKSLNLQSLDTDMSLFEMNIRFIGGLLSSHTLTNDKFFLLKAQEIADSLMPAFDTPTGIPYSLVNPKRKTKQNYNWASAGCSILAEIGTLSLEYQYLTDHTGNKIYEDKIKKIYELLESTEKDTGLYYNYINPTNAKWCQKHASLGALGDSFYEYLIKYWLYTNKKDEKILDMFKNTLDSIRRLMIATSSTGLTYVGEYNSRLISKMDHLTCFVGGLFTLTTLNVPLNDADKNYYKELAMNVTHTCHESYDRTPTKIGPEAFHFERSETDAQAIKSNEKYYILRPEVIEGYFYLWRLTHDNKYRDWAWQAVEAIEKYCKTDNGYSGIRDVYSSQPEKDDVQQSFFLAETLKYLYLIYSDDNILPLDKYVFNTEAHPLKIRQ